jgi:HD-GYP domain-containing protein (c-di-GMP phosphodiesterase class II)
MFQKKGEEIMRLDLEQFIFALSDTVDLVGVNELLHSKRVGTMAWRCSETLGFDKQQQKRLLHLGLLHDCGVSSTREHKKLVSEMDWKNSNVHCRIGASRMAYFGPLESFAETILYHHTRWEVLKDTPILEKTKLEANLLYLLDRVDYLGHITPGSNWISKKDAVRHKIKQYRNTYFNPDLVEAFLHTSEKEAFWFSLEPLMIVDFMEQCKRDNGEVTIPAGQLITVATLFAQIVDAKSPCTAEHSCGVAQLSTYLAENAGFDSDTCLRIKVTGLLHDLGKLQIPDRILEKPGPLSGEDLAQMQHHSYVSYRILNKISGLEDIALWTANHHETLDGSGYPFHKKADELDTVSRIVAVADIFQALAQTRPYRDGRPMEEIVSFLQKNAAIGRLDSTLVEMVADNKVRCYEIAMGNL